MAPLHHHSHKCSMAELDSLRPPWPMTQLLVGEKQSYAEVLPPSTTTDRHPIEFFVPGDGKKICMDPNDTLLHLCLKIVEEDVSDPPNDAAVALISWEDQLGLTEVLFSERCVCCAASLHVVLTVLQCFLPENKNDGRISLDFINKTQCFSLTDKCVVWKKGSHGTFVSNPLPQNPSPQNHMMS